MSYNKSDMLGITKADIFWGLKIMSLGIATNFIAIFLIRAFPAYNTPIIYANVGIIAYLMLIVARKTDWRRLR